ncbi:ABC transporter substrate-binding protein [Halopelagius fulvigenes]|uniref:ABC transporter substrate-binding protein n=1 Tax=Halopelagius fulvigenes TaxID=1198324 RepID=A0ABD5TXA6_9EURY
MSSDTSSDESGFARRRFLKLSGTAGAVTLAGCSSEPSAEGGGDIGTLTGGDGSVTTSSGGSTASDERSLTVPSRFIPAETQWNPYAPSNYAEVAGKMVFDPFLRYNQKTGELIPYVLQDWRKDGKTLTMSIREGQTWHDGNPVTAEDFVTKFTIDKGLGYEITNYIDAVEAVNDSTIKYTLKRDYGEKTILVVIAGKWMNTPTSEYGKFAQRFRDASSEEEKKTVQGDLQDYQPSEPLGCGPCKYDSANQQVLTLTKYEDHPDANQIQFPVYELEYFASSQQKWAAMKNGRNIDIVDGFTPIRIAKTFPDYVRQYKVPTYNGYGLGFNHDDEDFGKRNVRRAIAYVVDQQRMAELADPLKTAVAKPVGLGSFITDTWKENLGGDVDVYDSYTSTEKAAALLKKEGYSKKGEQWHKPNGEQFTLSIPSPSGWSDVTSFTTTLAQMLSDFGIKTENRAVENTTFFGQYWGTSNFKVVPWFWNNSGKTEPFFSLSWILTSNTVMSNLNYGEKPKAPPVGEPNGEASPVNVRETLRRLSTTSDRAKAQEYTRELAWVVNQNLPMLPLIEKIHPSFWNGQDWDIPPADTNKKFVDWCSYWFPRIGAVSPVQRQ